MHANPVSLQPPRLLDSLTHWIVGFVAAVMLALIATVAHAAPPPAGTSISNQASASYSDASGVTRSVTSNVVQTTVAQVASLTLTANGAQSATPGSIVYYPHTLTNTGNGTDTFNLSAVNAGTPTFTMGSIQIFLDNGSGQPTGPAITGPVSVAAGATYKFIVQGTVPSTAVAGNTNALTVTATSVFDNTKTTNNTDTTTVTTNAVVTVTKAVSVASGPAGTGLTYTLTYTNTGNSTATSVAISDVLATQTTTTPGVTYVGGSARWSVTGNTALSDTGISSGTSPNTIVSNYNATTKTLSFTLAQLAANTSGTITFQVSTASSIPGVIGNTATTSYNNGSGTTVTGSTNTANFTVTPTAGVSMSGTTIPTGSPASAGSTVSFNNTVTNTGNATDTFNIVINPSPNTFPAGTTFALFKADGVTPLVNTNAGDSIPDTGPLAPAATYVVVLKATLPPNAPSGSTGYAITKTATSVNDATQTATATDTLTRIVGNTVDLTNDSPTGVGVPGAGAGPEGAAVKTLATNPGTTVTFSLVANNTGPTPDTYNLGVSTSSTFATATLPAGWTVTFKNDTTTAGAACSTTGATVTNSGTVAAGGAAKLCAVVTIPAGYAAGTSDIYFRTLSSTSGATDTIHDAVTVNAVRSVAFTPNGSGQTYPGGSFVYAHTLTNNGNVTEGNGTLSTIALAGVNNQAGWTSVLYYDLNNNGTLDATDPQISGNLNSADASLAAGLAPGASIRVFNKVIAPSGAVIGAVNATTITVSTSNGTYTTTVPAAAVATDSTTVIAGNLTLVKEQRLDSTCAGAAAGTYTQGNISAKPGECVMYRITVLNIGSAAATNVVVTDSTPSYTTLSTAAIATPAGATAATSPAVGASGAVSAPIADLAAGASGTLTFGVKIAQ